MSKNFFRTAIELAGFVHKTETPVIPEKAGITGVTGRCGKAEPRLSPG
jgi:hypothetical protein